MLKSCDGFTHDLMIEVFNMTVLEKLQQDGIQIPAACGGLGICGKCAVKVSKNAPEPTERDRTVLGGMVEVGFRLACITPYKKNMEIEWNQKSSEKGFSILTMYEPQSAFTCNRAEKGLGMVIDIGTTTIAFELLEMSNGRRVANHTMVNSQRMMGADVVTRIKMASQGKQYELFDYIKNDICNGLQHFSSYLHDINFLFIAGNTTMMHILLGYPCESLGQYPFTPISVDLIRKPFGDVFCSPLLHCDVTVLPGISAFVGADIVAGIHFCRSAENKNDLLIDLGTNGEMALITENGIYTTSTAAGPAFEAGNISHGMGSVPGAIARVWLTPEGKAGYETINNQPPLGLCGTGVVDIAAVLVKAGLVDETGLLVDQYFDDGFPVAPGILFTQKDVREIQLAKSAVRAGIEILMEEAGCGYGDIAKVYLAGGFGHKIDLDSAVTLGIIPLDLHSKVITVGNAALGGCAGALLSPQAETDMTTIARKAKEVNLSAHPRFNDLFMDYMMF
jgi:uncharacterized 2Fe-2S/4Fe-4S cluster protein (DUF4445 family)